MDEAATFSVNGHVVF